MSENERAVPKIVMDANNKPMYRLLVHIWSDGCVSFNDELCRVDFDGDLVDSRLIEWSAE